ncbi:hypothetical protein FYK55_25005 [Roseiconus nitratireducens]|uniref:Lipoprotein n=1 Tax=Roseiconus nitratireducens TaxID=2605748 RepID=A0A5M6CYV3_9BACT|nr:hypothetical protein [Roseiconus nitratireducens]KAA5539182.1 hypothetical protein FYK55_25005 [Roseiconus nitratireducens]
MKQFCKAFVGQKLVWGVLLICLAAGCSQKETILDVETPDGGVEVQQDKETGEVSVEVED